MKALPRSGLCPHPAGKHGKGLGCWNQLVAMVYTQLSGVNSLRAVLMDYLG